MGKLSAEYPFGQQEPDLLCAGIGTALLDPTKGKCSDGFVEIIYDREFFPTRHAPDDLDLHLFYFGMGISIQCGHDLSIAHMEEICNQDFLNSH